MKEKATPGRELTARQRQRNRRFGKVRAKVEHVFRVLKCQFGYRRVRYRGIVKNGAHVFSLLTPDGADRPRSATSAERKCQINDAQKSAEYRPRPKIV